MKSKAVARQRFSAQSKLWFPWQHVGFGAAYNYVDVNVTKESDVVQELEFDYKYDGAFVYLRLAY